ncbi:MAG TPA: amino acid permease [bacterium]|nr:amino acid permease [bacterium]
MAEKKPVPAEIHHATGIVPTLGLLGSSMNAMALIAPGAFLWITYQLQAAATTPSGASCANDMWSGILVALVLAFLTAFSYAELAKLYPEAGFASCAYFAEKAFLDSAKSKRAGPQSMARIAKLTTGWAAHLFYWVYPGVMVAMFAILVGYLYTAFSPTGATLNNATLTLISIIFAFGVGFIAFKGVQGSTITNIWVNIIQWIALVVFSVLAIIYRWHNPEGATAFTFSGAVDIVKFHSIQGVLVQSTIAILILVGFESATAGAAETIAPEKTIPKAIIIALVVQGLCAYLFEYFAANYMVSEKLTGVTSVAAPVAAAAPAAAGAAPAAAAPVMITQTVHGMDAMAASSAPIGDMCRAIGDHVLPGVGFGLMVVIAITVIIAVVGTTLSCMNTAVRVTNGMADDRELPEFLAFLHTENKTPHTAIGVLVVLSCVIAGIGVQSVDGLTGITLASNFGTFVLYGQVCIWTWIAYKGRPDFSLLKHFLVPLGGLILNIVMCGGIFYLNFTGTADNKIEAAICFYIAGAWALISFLYVMLTTVHKNYGMKMITAMIRPDALDDLVSALNSEGLVQGMTVSEVKGFGRQRGGKDHGDVPAKIKFLPKARVELAVNDWDVPHVIQVMETVLNTGSVGDGKIFVFDTEETVRVRTGESGIAAV